MDSLHKNATIAMLSVTAWLNDNNNAEQEFNTTILKNIESLSEKKASP